MSEESREEGQKQSMGYLIVKVLVSAVIIVAVSEIAKRSSTFGGLVAALPLTSILAMVWLFVDTGDAEGISELSTSIFWLVLPSLSFFLILPPLLERMHFAPAMVLSIVAMLGIYAALLAVLGKLGLSV